MTAAAALARAHKRFPATVATLARFVRFPTVSTHPARAADHDRCAAWLAGVLRGIGMTDAVVVPTAGRPAVLASWRGAPDRPTLLVYGHYDVQPAEPLSAWHLPPFGGVVHGNALFGRGASDDKGQILAHIAAIDAYLGATGRIPVNVVCLVEGEEEIGSPSLATFLDAHRDALRADAAVVSDMAIAGRRRPAITYAMRGGLGLELAVRRPGRDVHSGSFGGAVANPLEALAAIVASLHDSTGRVSVPGFYDRVRSVDRAERAEMARYGPSEAAILRSAGVVADEGGAAGEPGFTAYERTTVRPTVSINGLTGGYAGPGAKAVIPTWAVAKLSCRLVPDQDPATIERLIRRHVARVAPPGVTVAITRGLAARPVEVARRQPAIRAAREAYARGFGTPPVFLRGGGTVPVIGELEDVLGIPVVLLGLGLPTDAIHAPDEHMELPAFGRAIATCVWFLSELASTVGRDARPVAARRAPPVAGAGAGAGVGAL